MTSRLIFGKRRLCLPKLVPSLQHEWPAYDFLQPYVPEIEVFQRKVHSQVLDPLLRLFALLLELPEGYFAEVGQNPFPTYAQLLPAFQQVLTQVRSPGARLGTPD